jgi:hypothetical protein
MIRTCAHPDRDVRLRPGVAGSFCILHGGPQPERWTTASDPLGALPRD